MNELLSKYNVALCAADTPDTKPTLTKTADFTYVRLRKDQYSKSDLTEWREKLLEFAKDSGDCFVYFKHDETGNAANLATDFKTMLTA